MPPNSRNRLDVFHTLCRICGKEDNQVIPIFGEEGKKQNLHTKIKICLPVTISESDIYPKQICLSCLSKLEDCWNMVVLCKEAQLVLEKRYITLKNQENVRQIIAPPIEETLKNLTDYNPILYGQSAVICLATEATLPPSSCSIPATRETQVIPRSVAAGSAEPVMVPVTYYTPASAPSAAPAAPPPVTEDVYPQGLIQVSQQHPIVEQPVVYQNRPLPASVSVPAPAPVPVPAPAPVPQSIPRRRPIQKPATTPSNPPRPVPNPLKRQNEEISNASQAKKHCRYCNKYFTDDIIDHHISLHLRQTFRTCLDCNKNFRSEEAMERHRCGANEPIDLDADDEPIVL